MTEKSKIIGFFARITTAKHSGQRFITAPKRAKEFNDKEVVLVLKINPDSLNLPDKPFSSYTEDYYLNEENKIIKKFKHKNSDGEYTYSDFKIY